MANLGVLKNYFSISPGSGNTKDVRKLENYMLINFWQTGHHTTALGLVKKNAKKKESFLF